MTDRNLCTLRSIFFAALLLFGHGTTAGELAPGERFPTLSLPDQHGQVHAIGEVTEIILFAADRPASDLLNGFLKAQVDGFLESRNAEYIADISTMPSIITRLVALPRMRDRPYRIMLVEDPAQTAFLPRQEGAVTIVRLTDLRVESVEFAADTETLAAALPPE
jgi:hypothetical protein